MCSPIGHNNTKHFLCPIRSRHPLEFLEMVRWESVPRGSSALTWKLSSRLFSRPDWLPLGLRGWPLLRVSFFIIIVLFSYFKTREYNSYKAKAMPFRMPAVGTCDPPTGKVYFECCIFKVSWIIPITKVCPSPWIIGEQDSVHVLNLGALFWASWLGKLKLNVCFGVITLRKDSSEMQKNWERPKFVFPSFCERFICETCVFDQVIYLP